MTPGRLEIYTDRELAGQRLGAALRARPLGPHVVVVGLPRGGVPLAYEVAHTLQAPLDVLPVRKLGLPGEPELAFGAVAPGGVVVVDPGLRLRWRGREQELKDIERRELAELARREQLYRRGLPPLALQGKTAVLVDDGLATGATMLAAVRSARQAGASRIVCAAPVGSREAAALLRGEADDVVLLQVPDDFLSVGQWYERFDQVPDEQVQRLLSRAASGGKPPSPRSPGTS